MRSICKSTKIVAKARLKFYQTPVNCTKRQLSTSLMRAKNGTNCPQIILLSDKGCLVGRWFGATPRLHGRILWIFDACIVYSSPKRSSAYCVQIKPFLYGFLFHFIINFYIFAILRRVHNTWNNAENNVEYLHTWVLCLQ